MTLDELATFIPHGKGAMKLRYLRRQQPAEGLSAADLEERAHAAASWIRGYAHCLVDHGRISEAEFPALWDEISRALEGCDSAVLARGE